jgi:hypothetical protein
VSVRRRKPPVQQGRTAGFSACSPPTYDERVREEGDMAELSERDAQILAFEGRAWRHPGAKEQAMHDVLNLAPTRYYQILNELIDTPEALRFDPVLIKRLRRQRSRRQRMRSPRTPE